MATSVSVPRELIIRTSLQARSRSSDLARGLAALGAVLLAAALSPVTVARADGDPASDVLLGENVFYPYTPPVTARIEKALDAETAAVKRSGFPIKVALIGSPVDLGVIPDLFGKPQKYADFLDQEISFRGKQPLIVVMAAGYGVQGLGAKATAAAASLRSRNWRPPPVTRSAPEPAPADRERVAAVR